MMKQAGAQLLEEHVSFHEIMSVLKQADYVIGLRLHSLILACVLHIPFIGISYDPKIDRFVERAGMPCAGHIRDLQREVLLPLIEERISQLPREREIIAKHAQALVEDSLKSSKLVLQALAKAK